MYQGLNTFLYEYIHITAQPTFLVSSLTIFHFLAFSKYVLFYYYAFAQARPEIFFQMAEHIHNLPRPNLNNTSLHKPSLMTSYFINSKLYNKKTPSSCCNISACFILILHNSNCFFVLFALYVCFLAGANASTFLLLVSVSGTQQYLQKLHKVQSLLCQVSHLISSTVL